MTHKAARKPRRVVINSSSQRDSGFLSFVFAATHLIHRTNMKLLYSLMAVMLQATMARNVSSGPYTNLDCRNRKWQQDGGDLIVMSWHIHYTTNTSDMARFQVKTFSLSARPSSSLCAHGSHRLW